MGNFGEKWGKEKGEKEGGGGRKVRSTYIAASVCDRSKISQFFPRFSKIQKYL